MIHLFFFIFKSQLVASVYLINVWRCGGGGLGAKTPWWPPQGQR
jgi:hypothetical protein